MKLSQLAAQLYTVRDCLSGPANFSRTIERLKQIGYPAVELIPSDSVSDKEIAKICGDAGITVAAAHVPGKTLLQTPQTIVEKLQTVGTRLGVYAFPGEIDLGSRPQVERMADQLQKAAETLTGASLILAYHNHAMEFSRLDGELVYDVLRRRAPAVSFEFDTYWAQVGGVSSERWIRELGSRLVSLHLKDYGVVARHGEPPFMAEVGYGNLDFPILIPEAERAGCEWFIVEQDITPGDPFVSLEKSFRYVSKKLI